MMKHELHVYVDTTMTHAHIVYISHTLYRFTQTSNIYNLFTIVFYTSMDTATKAVLKDDNACMC